MEASTLEAKTELLLRIETEIASLEARIGVLKEAEHDRLMQLLDLQQLATCLH